MTAPREEAPRPAGGEPAIRAFRPEDKPGIVAVIKSVYDDYNYIVDFDHFEADLVDVQSTYQDAGGAFWVLDDGGAIAGCVGVLPREGDACELKRLYVGRAYRRRGWGSRLLATARGWAIAGGFRRMYLWSDVLLEAGHRLYMKSGFRMGRETRAIDPTNPTSVERFFIDENL
ncbi:MAG: GNAT family N-acetyltransferase [Candidatus Krumholzibacteria bacterium]|nr:GNAT family N-acetyltransferase [Candidatus Krumholzibacteria bacterium]